MNQYYEQEVTSVEILGGYRLRVTFAEGFSGEIDLSPLIGRGPIYAPLRNVEFFQQVKVSPEWGVLEWSDDLELSPGSLRAWCEAGEIMDHDATDAWIDQHASTPETAA